MSSLTRFMCGLASVACLFACFPSPAVAADVATAFPIAGGSLSLEAPEGFERVQPKSSMIEAEFAVPSEGELPAGRMTVMGAGGTVEANIDRWSGQFTQPGGGDTKDKLTKKSFKVAGCGVTIVDIAGTYLDQPGGPFAGGPKIERPGYRMLAAIVERHAAGFQKMVEGMVPAGR